MHELAVCQPPGLSQQPGVAHQCHTPLLACCLSVMHALACLCACILVRWALLQQPSLWPCLHAWHQLLLLHSVCVCVRARAPLLQGYYEGEQLLHLAHWVACAAIEAELPLLHTLCTMPWPYRPSLVLMPVASAAAAAAAAAGADPPESPGSVAYWAAVATGSNGYGYGTYHFTPAEAGVVPLGPQLFAGLCVPHALQLMSAWEMAKYRPDGYRGLAAPLLFGEAGEGRPGQGRRGQGAAQH